MDSEPERHTFDWSDTFGVVAMLAGEVAYPNF